jgi:hypothetical protein
MEEIEKFGIRVDEEIEKDNIEGIKKKKKKKKKQVVQQEILCSTVGDTQ